MAILTMNKQELISMLNCARAGHKEAFYELKHNSNEKTQQTAIWFFNERIRLRLALMRVHDEYTV